MLWFNTQIQRLKVILKIFRKKKKDQRIQHDQGRGRGKSLD